MRWYLVVVAMIQLYVGLASGERRRCRSAADCESCSSAGCAWCSDLSMRTGGRCLALGGNTDCGGKLQRSCLNTLNPTLDTDRVSQTIDRAVPPARHAETTPANGRKIASALNLQTHMQRIVDSFPTSARFLSNDPPIIQIDDFLSTLECDAIISAAEPSMTPSIGLNEKQYITRAVSGHKCAPHSSWQVWAACQGRSSHSAWCNGPCASSPTIKRIEAKIANVTGFSMSNMEPFQILRYGSSQEYQAHHDFIPGQPGKPHGPRVFTFLMYLNDVPAGGATWFPHAVPANSSDATSRSVSEADLKSFYKQYSVEKARRLDMGMHELCCGKPLEPASRHFQGVGLRVVPQKGSAVMWPNVDFDNV